MILFQWHGEAPFSVHPDEQRSPGRNARIVSCAAVFPSKTAFMNATGMTRAAMKMVSMLDPVEGREPGNEGWRLAVESPGVVFWLDTTRHIPRDAPWLVHPDDGRPLPKESDRW